MIAGGFLNWLKINSMLSNLIIAIDNWLLIMV